MTVRIGPLRLVLRLLEGVDDLQPLREFFPLGIGLGLHHLGAERGREALEIQLLEHALDGLSADPHLELVPILFSRTVQLLVGQEAPPRKRGLLGVHDDVVFEIKNPLQILQGQVEEIADLGGETLQEPDVRDRGGELDVAHPLAPHLGLDDLDTALLADDAAVLHPLVFTAVALIVLDGAEDLGAEKPVPLRLECAVVDRLGLLHLAMRPLPDLLRGGQGDLDCVVARGILGLREKIV